MNSKIINSNIINQISNQELYEPILLDFLLNNSDIKQLQSDLYNNYSSNGVYLKSNFEGFLYTKFYEKESEMKSKIYSFFEDKLEEPKYFAAVEEKKYNDVLSKNIFLFFRKGANAYLENVHNKTEEPLNSNEEKFIVNYILNKDASFYLNDNSKEELYKILYNQREYLQFKNSKSQKNIFLQHDKLKKVLDMFSNDKVDLIIGEKPTAESLVQTYFKKLHRSKVFDLNSKLKGRSPEEINQAMEKVLGKYSDLNWFTNLIKYGTGLSLTFFEEAYMNDKFEAIFRNVLNERKPSAIFEMINLIELTKDVSTLSKDLDDIAKVFLIVASTGRESYYLQLRESFEIPEHIHASFSTLKIGKKTVKEIEVDVLQSKLQQELNTNPTNSRKMKI